MWALPPSVPDTVLQQDMLEHNIQDIIKVPHSIQLNLKGAKFYFNDIF